MQHHNSLIHGVLKPMPWGTFDKLVDKHGADKHVRTLSTKSQLVALIHAQLSGATSLREIEATPCRRRVFDTGPATRRGSIIWEQRRRSARRSPTPTGCVRWRFSRECSRRCLRKPIPVCGGRRRRRSA